MQTEVWEHRVLIFSIACHLILLWRLWAEKLTGLYLFLTVFLAGATLQSAGALLVRPRSTAYGNFFFISTPILWILAYFVVLELYRLILEDYPGIASAGRRATNWCMGLAIAVSIAYAIPDLRSSTEQFPILRIYYIFERSVVLSLLLFLVLIQLFLFRYRLRLSPNRVFYATGYALYFGIGVAQDILFTTLGLRVVYTFNLWTVVVAGLILLAGAWFLSSEGEIKVKLEAKDSSADRIRLQQQLADINQLLTRAARGRG
jgi:hypothetical protein